MARQDTKKVTAEVSKEVWKTLKTISIQKEVSLQEVLVEVIDRGIKNKVKLTTTTNDEKEQ